jgi:hypothetical protein
METIYYGFLHQILCFLHEKNFNYHQAEFADNTENLYFIFTKMQIKEFKVTVFWDGALCRLVEVSRGFRDLLMIGAANTSKILVNFYQTAQHNTPEDIQLHSCHCENLNLTKEK